MANNDDGALNRLNPDRKVRMGQYQKDFGANLPDSTARKSRTVAAGTGAGGERVNVARCLDAMVLTGKIGRDGAEQIIKQVTSLQDQYSKRMNMTAAELAAARRTAEILKEAAAKKKQQVALQLLAQHRVIEQASSHSKGFAAGVLAHLTKDKYGEARWSNVEYRHKVVFAQLNALGGDVFAQHMPGKLGFAMDHPGFRAAIRELYGEGTQDAAGKAIAEGFRASAEEGRNRFNRSGGDIKKRHDWFVPQQHDRWRVREAGPEWARFVADLNYEIRDPETGEVLPEIEARAALDAMQATIGSGGANNARLGANFGTSKLANTRGDPRLLQFKDADSWLAYNDRFGSGSIYRLMARHLDGIARDIALLETLGPNPDATIRFLADAIRMANATNNPNAYRIARLETKLAQTEDATAREALSQQIADLRRDVRPGRGQMNPMRLLDNARRVEAVYDVVAGRSATPDDWLSDLSLRVMAGMRGVMGMAQLGSAPISSVTDLKTFQATAAWNGLDATRAMKHQLSLLNPMNEADKAFARRAGLIAEEVAHMASSARRFADDVGEGLIARASNAFHRITGLTPWSRATRGAFGLEFMATLADNAGRELKDLDEPLRRALENRSITPAMWDAVRKAGLTDYGGSKFMVPTDLAKSDNRVVADTAQRLHELILQETDYAIPEPDAMARTMLTLGTKSGTGAGELLRTLTMYKSFTVSLMMTHGMRTFYQTQTAGKSVLYGLDLVVGLTVLGGAAIQFRQIATGKDPRDMTRGDFWLEAGFQGGGLGIFGDFIRAGLSRKDKDVVGTFVGPGMSLVGDLFRLGLGNVREAADGVPTHFSGELARFAQSYLPGNNIWYARLITDRLLFSRLHMLAEPNYPSVAARIENKAAKEYSQRFWWRPGQAAPERMPSVGAAVGVKP